MDIQISSILPKFCFVVSGSFNNMEMVNHLPMKIVCKRFAYPNSWAIHLFLFSLPSIVFKFSGRGRKKMRTYHSVTMILLNINIMESVKRMFY